MDDIEDLSREAQSIFDGNIESSRNMNDVPDNNNQYLLPNGDPDWEAIERVSTESENTTDASVDMNLSMEEINENEETSPEPETRGSFRKLETEEQFSRFKGLPWFDVIGSRIIVIGGAGGIGSYLSFFLARAGFTININDFDTVERGNLSGQFFKSLNIGSKKVKAVYENVKEFSPSSRIFTSYSQITSETRMDGLYFMSAFDNMEARKNFFNIWKRNLDKYEKFKSRYDIDVPIFIDGRLEAEQLQIFCVTKERISDYEKFLYDDSEIEDVACTMKQTSHVAAMIASFMTVMLTNHVTNIYYREYVRDVPFKFEIFTPLNKVVRI